MTRVVDHARVTERDTTTENHHVIYLRSVTCGDKSCSHGAHRWARCPKCRKIVARCGAHEHRFEETVRTHC